MKKIKNSGYIAFGTLILLLVTVSWGVVGFTQNSSSNGNLSFIGKLNNESYVLGEPVTIEFTFKNTGKKQEKVAGAGVETGGLKIFIAYRVDSDYKEYFVGSWGRERGSYKTIEPGQTHTLAAATILWHGKPNVSHLNEVAANRVLKGKVTTEYAFQEPGVYFIKGRSYFDGDATPIDSAPIRIEIKQPEGDDLEVWNQIKGNKEIALLMQNGSFDTPRNETKQQLIGQVEQIILNHPNSQYSNYLKPKLEKYKTDELKRSTTFQNH